MLPTINCPATCELCGNWLPEHTATCPRNGVHPSQWSFDLTEEGQDEEVTFVESDEQTDSYIL